uniref:Uncharacterized protein n=1 Tax=Octopus bimaculoides TaxID=37653 RepID=A0A0L8FFY9_OCTBM
MLFLYSYPAVLKSIKRGHHKDRQDITLGYIKHIAYEYENNEDKMAFLPLKVGSSILLFFFLFPLNKIIT